MIPINCNKIAFLVELYGLDIIERRNNFFMKIKDKNNNKILKFSIRKLSLGAAPVVIGALIFGSYVPSEVLANENTNVNYTYLS